MPSTRNPLLSLDAKGSIADTLTYQDHPSGTIVRSKPTPTQRLTLPVQYQRWLYIDYCALWRQQSQATKLTYRMAGSEQHLTGFQYWMKYHLTNLPDIAAYWKLDINNQPTTPDASRNSNTLTVTGASPITGTIDRAFNFDGANDILSAPHTPSLMPTAFTLECFFTLRGNGTGRYQLFLNKYPFPSSAGYYLERDQTTKKISFGVRDPIAGASVLTDPVAPTIGVTYHYLATFDGNLNLYRNGTHIRGPQAGTMAANTEPFQIGAWRQYTEWCQCRIDQVILYNRILTPADIARHSARRWPPQ